MRIFKKKEEFWDLINRVIELINEDKEAEKYFNFNIIATYIIFDLDLNFTVIVKNNRISVEKGKVDDAEIILEISSENFHKIIMGEIDFTFALLKDKLAIKKGKPRLLWQAANLPIQDYYPQAFEELKS